LCGVHEYASAQFLVFLELAENGDFWIGNKSVPLIKLWMDTSCLPINAFNETEATAVNGPSIRQTVEDTVDDGADLFDPALHDGTGPQLDGRVSKVPHPARCAG